MHFCASSGSFSCLLPFPGGSVEEGHGTALLAESELAGHRSPAKSHSLCMLVERCMDPSTARKTEHGCFPGHLLKANIWLVGLQHSRCHLGKWSCWLELAVKAWKSCWEPGTAFRPQKHRQTGLCLLRWNCCLFSLERNLRGCLHRGNCTQCRGSFHVSVTKGTSVVPVGIPASRLQLCHLESSLHISIMSSCPLLPHSLLYSSLSARQLEHGTMRHAVSPGKWA